MASKTDKLLIITNLYPTPWAPNRASFNRQQFERLSEIVDVKLIVLLAFTEWLKYRKKNKTDKKVTYIPFFYTPKFGRRFYPLFQTLSLLFCMPMMKEFNPRAILASWGYPDAIAVSLINKFLKKPLYIKIHGSDVNENVKYPSRIKQIVKHFNRADKIFSVSEALKRVLVDAGVKDSQIVVNYNGVDKSIFYPCDNQGRKSIVFVGNLIKEKGIVELLEVADSLGVDYEKYQFRIVGQGPLYNALTEKYEREDNNIKFLGSLPLNSVAKEIREASLLVLPSYREGVPNVILEAISSATPVVATDVGGISEVLIAECGIVIDSLSNLDKGIKDALHQNWSSEKIIEHSNTFDWKRNVDLVLDTIFPDKNESVCKTEKSSRLKNEE